MNYLNSKYNKIYCYLLIIYNFNLIRAQLDDGYEFRCLNGETISADEKCDGKSNCKDGSDETPASCIHFECPKYAFRCAYGGCVKRNAECDGVKDCADNSDEISAKCLGQSNNANNSQQTNNLNNAGGECLNQKDTFKCGNGDCISSDSVCDGKKDCADGSDESINICSSVDCPSYAFRCGYGACIDRNLKCNGVENCADGSDETTILCRKYPATDRNVVTTSTTTKKPIPTPPKPKTGCRTENIPHLYFTFNDQDLSPGELVESSVTITYRCESQYFLEGELSNLCLNNQWQLNHPTCSKFCPYIHLKGVTFQVDCYYNKLRITCDQPLRPGTVARISCQVGYHKPADDFPEVLHCDNDGRWDYNPSRCFQSCGEEPAQITPFIGGGETVNITSVPWQVAIYSKLESSGYQQICGGTILNARVILSAAHCFFDDSNRKLYDRQYYTVAAGKSFRSYTSEKYAQFSNISEIHIPLNYEGIHLRFINDFAIIILNNDLRFNNYIKPACIQWKEYSDKIVQSGVQGRVAGWGITTSGKPSHALQVLDLETLSHTDCVEATKSGEPPTKDKFCVRNPYGAVCQGDSGGGFLIPENLGSKKRYYLWGIVSHGGISQSLSCMDNSITTFTNIQFFRQEIEEYLGKHNPR